MRRQLHRRGTDQRGQSLVEFAIFVPIVLILLVAIGDLARVYTTMITVESAAREAADWGAYRPGNWESATYSATLEEMERRACTPSRALTDYAGSSDGSTCSNPTFECELYLPESGSWVSCNQSTSCNERVGAGVTPCKVRVRLTHTFSLLFPTDLLTLPNSFTFTRSSTFNVADEPSS